MKHDDPATWTAHPLRQAVQPLWPGDRQTPGAIVEFAVAAMGCDVACVFRLTSDTAERVVCSDADLAAELVRCGPSTSTSVEFVDGSGPLVELRDGDRTIPALGCTFPLGRGATGLLLIARRRGAVRISAAQGYVLRALAAHLDTLLRQDDMDAGAPEPLAVQRERVERLRLLESVAVHARDSIIITEAEPIDRPGPRILYCNAAFTRATGYEPHEVIGRTPRILQGARTTPESRATLRAALEAWEPIEIELINYKKDGTEFWVELSIVPVADETGWYTHWVSVQRDITERKQAEELSIRVRVAEGENEALANEIEERRRVEAELLYTAFHDSLTRLRNRAYFMDRLATVLAARHRAPCAVLFLDLDQFKVVNDSLGHLAGDTLLKELAGRLKGCARVQDTLARIGGDEFALLLEDTADPQPAVEVAEAILAAMREPVRLGRTDVFPSCSIGIVLSGGRTATPEDLIRDADIAMYEAKRQGPGDYAIFTEGMHASAVDALALRTDLRRAIEDEQFELHYQPIVRPATGELVGFEALLRWEDAVRGVILPDVFVPVAEDLGLIRAIGRWVLGEACRRLAEWQVRHGRPDLRMSVNVSATEFMHADFLPELATLLKVSGIRPATLELEITESILLNPSPSIETLIHTIRKLGVRVSLDDFGTGYSSLRYINQYPIDAIKIDKSFVRSMCSDDRTLAIVEAVVNLGAKLKIDVVAEGIETARHESLVRELGCPLGQGYWFARPMTRDDAGAYLLNQQPTQPLLLAS